MGKSKERYRFIPAMSEQPFLLSPVLSNNFDVLDLYGSFPWKAVDSITFERPQRGSVQYNDTFTVRLYIAPGFPRSAEKIPSRREVADLQGRAFWPDPLSVTPSHYVDFEGSPGLHVSTPGEVIVEIPKQAKSFSGFFGILPEAYTGKGKTDGVEFGIDVQAPSGRTRRLFDRLVQPLTRPGDRGRLSFKIPIDSSHYRKVILSTGAGPKRDNRWDWSMWANCRFSNEANPKMVPTQKAPARVRR